ncbi:MAG TPA: hypothetical protein PLJ74_05380 [Myxococcota bacterium]|nr:hypothetical protein [Myxococcota bacterium]
MSFYYLYNPKNYGDNTWKHVSDAIKRRRKPDEPEPTEKVELVITKASEAHTEELQNRIRQYNDTAARIAQIESMAQIEATILELQKLALAKMALAQTILEMEEEEGVLLLLLLN